MRALALASLITAAVAISWASILILLSGANSITISFWRLAIASLALMPLAWNKLKSIEFKAVKWLLISGIGLAVHFVTWITSLFYTTVAASTTIVSTYVIFVLPLTQLAGRRETTRNTVVGTVTALIGVAVIAYGNYGGGWGSVLGDVLAMAGSISGALYFVSGKSAREYMDTASYGATVYGIGAMIVLLIALLLHVDVFSVGIKAWPYILLLVVGPMLGGHTLINYSIKYYRSVTVATSTLVEPIGSTIIAYFLLSQRPPLVSYMGMAITLVSIYIVIREEIEADRWSSS